MKIQRLSILCSIVAMIGGATLAETSRSERFVVSQDWLSQTFSNKTWKWDNGHAYFGPDGKFQAVIGRSQSAEGKWYTVRGGKICFQADWTSGNTTSPVKKCWKHIVDAQNRVLQIPLEGSLLPSSSPFDPAEQLLPGNVYKYRFEYVTNQRKSIDGKPMDALAIARMYAGKTWKWEDGHAYFGDGGVLTAISGPNEIAEGRWFATRKGNLCIDATWTGPGYGSVRDKSCWLHAKDKQGNVWQSPTSEVWRWTKFSPRRDLVRGDVFRARFERQKRRLVR